MDTGIHEITAECGVAIHEQGGERREKQHRAVERHGDGQARAITKKSGGCGDQREEEEKNIVIPKQFAVGALDGVKKLVVMRPECRDDEETDDEAEKLRRNGGESIHKLGRTGLGAQGRQFHIKDHDGDDDGEDAVAESLKATGFGQEFSAIHGDMTVGCSVDDSFP